MTEATTRRLAAFALASGPLPTDVQAEAVRAFVNFIGCALGGARHDAVERTFRTLARLGGGGTATLIGRSDRLGPLDAALVNCQASAAHAFDDTHLATVVHPAGPIAAALLAEAERRPVAGGAFLAAFAVGVEVSCRVAAALVLPPADGQLGWYATGVSAPIGAAAAVARLRALSEDQTVQALGVAANQAAGFRQTHGGMCTSLTPANAARAGYWSALLAEAGVTASEQALEGKNGFFDVFAHAAHPAHATDAIGRRWEMLANMPKPYPCGIVIHPSIDGCLEIAGEPGFEADRIARVRLGVHPLCLTLCDRPEPPDSQRAQVSVQHWAAAALVRGAAGLPEGADAAVADAAIRSLRAKVEARPDPTVGRDGAVAVVEMQDGRRFERRIEHGVGSLEHPMSDDAIDAKFLAQAGLVLSEAEAGVLLALCRRAGDLDDMAEVLRATVPRP